jgi:AIPR protein
VITKTDLAKVQCCFNLEPDLACKGAEKAFVAFAERVSKEWTDESRRAIYGDDWFKSAVGRVILFRAAEVSISKAAWYEGGYRAQIVAYTCASLAKLSLDQEGSGGLDYIKVWGQQSAGDVLEQQIAKISEEMACVLKNTPLAGQNVSEWAKQQGCRRTALETGVPVLKGLDDWIVSSDDKRASKREQRATGVIDRGLDVVKQVLSRDSKHWEALRVFCRTRRILLPDDERALVAACQIPSMVPTDKQAARLLQLVDRAVAAGWQSR